MAHALSLIAKGMVVYVFGLKNLIDPRGSDWAIDPNSRVRYRAMNRLPKYQLMTKLALNLTQSNNSPDSWGK